MTGVWAEIVAWRRRQALRATVLKRPDLLAAADVFVSTSRSEGLPGAIVEAIGMGLPVVAFDVPGVGDVLGSEHPGAIPFGDQHALVGAIRDLLTDPDARARIGSSGRRRFEERFEIAAYSKRLTRIYRSLAGADAPHSRSPMRMDSQ